jgi:hypothetical protein
MLKVFVGVAKYGMEKKCAGKKSSIVKVGMKPKIQWILLKSRT